MDKELARQEARVLVEKYSRIVKEERDIKSKEEERTKKDLIRPLFERVLGWNFEEDVTAEEKISKGWVDYGFRINGVPKFFLEAKALGENLDNQKFFEQAVNYAYYKRCPWAVLTNFETIKILNAEWETPYYFSSHFMTIKCNEFLDRFEELWLLSKESFEQGSLDKLAERYGKKTKKTSVDKQLLNDFTKFRDMLSKDVTKRNPEKKLTQAELDESIQRILDRLIFIRNCEDRGLEEKKLWEARNETEVWKKVKEVFSYYDKNYDSKLFTYDPTDVKRVHLCDTLDIDDSMMREIIECLYRTKDQSISYDFSIIDADVLGTVYEQYLSHILRKTEKRATLTENHTHRKEQGVYYTPIYVVDYIVRNTLGELLKDKNVGVERIRVLDPACGSGSFLIKAFDVLNEYYRKNDKDYSQTQLDLETGTTFTRKVKILQRNIFGVDLDKQAVEITQLNLLLKIAEKGHRLPLLEQNIRCGNSLINDEKLAGDKAFKWEEQFNEIMREGGFDVVIGNPPYVRQEELSEIKPYLEANYETYQGTADLFVYFFEKELKILKEDGYFGMIVSNKWLRAGYGKNLRKLLTGFWIKEFIDFGSLRVFADATIYPCIIIIRKIKKPNPKIRICKMETLGFGSLAEYVRNNSFFINQSELSEKEWNIQKREGNELLKKIRSSGLPIEEYVGAKIYRGILTGLNEAFIIDEKKRDELIHEDSRNEELIKPFLTGAESKRYSIKSKKKYIIFTRRGIDILQYPSILRYLEQFRNKLSPKKSKEQEIGRKPGNYEWYEIQDSTAYYEDFEKPKIIWGNLATRSSFSLDETNEFYVNAPACILTTNSKYVLGILNSKLMSYFLKSICAERQGGFIEQKPVYVLQVPIKKPTKEQEIEITQHVEKMLQLNEKLLKIGDKLTDERAGIEDEIKKTDSETDELVYRIYGLTEDEKKTIEDSFK
jgi:type I restriction-modification system DNA methylase subunit